MVGGLFVSTWRCITEEDSLSEVLTAEVCEVELFTILAIEDVSVGHEDAASEVGVVEDSKTPATLCSHIACNHFEQISLRSSTTLL